MYIVYLYKHMYPNNTIFNKKKVIQFQHREKPSKKNIKTFQTIFGTEPLSSTHFSKGVRVKPLYKIFMYFSWMTPAVVFLFSIVGGYFQNQG